jgi:hypothetical protein
MSHTPEDLMLDYLVERQDVERDWADHLQEVVDGFTNDRLKSHYLANPELAEPSLEAWRYARELIGQDHPRAALVFAATAIEVGYKTVLFRPIVSGLVHTEALAEVVMGLATEHVGLDRFSKLMSAVLAEFADVHLKTLKRRGAQKLLWEEMKQVASLRNDVIHKAADVDRDAALIAIAVARELLAVVIPKVLRGLKLKLQGGTITAL